MDPPPRSEEPQKTERSPNLIFRGLLRIGLITVVWAVKTSNNIKRMEIKVDEAFSGIEVALTKRYDMLTKMLDVCRGFMKHESELFSKVISLRQGMSLGEMGRADREMGELTGRLFAVAENYPELRSAQVFAELQQGVHDAEEHLQAARRLYNASVSSYNAAIAVFPDSLLARGRSPREFFEAEDAKREDVKVQF